jgi:hypothetical protein
LAGFGVTTEDQGDYAADEQLLTLEQAGASRCQFANDTSMGMEEKKRGCANWAMRANSRENDPRTDQPKYSSGGDI